MPNVIPLLPHAVLQFGGAPAPPELMQDIGLVEVDTGLSLPDMFTIEVHDPQFRWVQHALLHVGQEVQVGTRGNEDEGQPPGKLLVGEITAIEATFPESGVPTLLLRGYDRGHHLHRGTKVRSFVQMTDSDIATKVAQERGLQADVDASTQVHEHITQHNLTDYEFLAQRARAIGYLFSVRERTLQFKKPASVTQPVVDLEYREGLLDFRPRLTTSSQVQEVTVKGYDPANKAVLVGRARASSFEASRTGWQKRGSAVATQAFGDAGVVHVLDHPVASQAEADAAAESLLQKLWSSDLQAEGQSTGNPKLRAGSMIRIKGVGDRFNGEYMVTRARHQFEAGGQYTTHFTVGGLAPDTTADLVMDGASQIETNHRSVARGVVVGIVTNNKDPNGLGRVKVKFPWFDDEAESQWARLAMPMAGDGRGFFFVPEVNDEVLVAFEHDDFNYPYVIGSLWNGRDKVPTEGSDAVGGDGAVNKRILKTRAGHLIVLDDTSGSEQIKVVDKTGSNSIVIDSAANRLTVEIKGEIVIKADQKVQVEARDVSVKASNKLELQATEIEMSGQARVKISGAMVELN